MLYLSFANPTESCVLPGRYTDFLIKVRKNMIFFVFMISTLKSLKIYSPFEMIEFRDVFCGYFLFEMTSIRIAKTPFHMIRKMISFRNVTEGEKSPIISKHNYPLYFKTSGHHHIEERGTHHIKRTVAHHFKAIAQDKSKINQ